MLLDGGTKKNARSSLRLLFQDYDAFPWLTVFENVRRSSGWSRPAKASAVTELLQSMGLAEHTERYPDELSGGLRKRLGLARALISEPKVLLLDEPFASLDVDTRMEMYGLLQSQARKAAASILLVTHDLEEAVLLSDRIILSGPRPFKVESEIHVPLGRPRTARTMETMDFLGALMVLHWKVSGSSHVKRASSDAEPPPIHPIARDAVQSLTLRYALEIVNPPRANEILDLMEMCLERLNSRVLMGGRSMMVASLCVLAWHGAISPKIRSVIGNREKIEALLECGSHMARDPSFAHPEWAVVLIGVTLIRWLSPSDALSETEYDELKRHMKSLLTYYSQDETLAAPGRRAAATILDQLSTRFPLGLTDVVTTAMEEWPKCSVAPIASELPAKLKALAAQLPASISDDERAIYRFALEQDGTWELYKKAAMSLS